MFKCLLRSSGYFINVYDGISPSLLATMSLSVDIKGKDQSQLVQVLQKNNLVQHPQQIQAYRKVDRRFFTRTVNPYENKPYPISKGQSMTDIFTHAVIISNLWPSWKHNVRVLDVGTGHGYLALLTASILINKGLSNWTIDAIDVNQQAISRSRQISQQLFGHCPNIHFHYDDLNNFLKYNDQEYDVIMGGFYFDEQTSYKLQQRLTKQGTGIWPTRSQHGQALYKIGKGRQKVYLIETLFSMPVLSPQIAQYFHHQNHKEEEQKVPEKEEKQQEEQAKSETLRQMRKQATQKVKGQLKELLDKHRRKDGKILSLGEMKQIPEISLKLQELQRAKRGKLGPKSSCQ